MNSMEQEEKQRTEEDERNGRQFEAGCFLRQFKLDMLTYVSKSAKDTTKNKVDICLQKGRNDCMHSATKSKHTYTIFTRQPVQSR